MSTEKLFAPVQISAIPTTRSRRWTGAAFFDKFAFCSPATVPIYWKSGMASAAAVRGLPGNETYDGVFTYSGHLLLWRGNTLKWCDVGDMTAWIPVGTTAFDGLLTLAYGFTQPSAGAEVGWVYVNETTSGLVPGVFFRLDRGTDLNIYSVLEVSPRGETTGKAIGISQAITDLGYIFTDKYYPWTVGSHITPPYLVDPLRVEDRSINENNSKKTSASFTVPAGGELVTVSFASNPGFTVGQFVSVSSTSTTPGLDVYQVKDVDTSTNTMTLLCMDVGAARPVPGTVVGVGANVVSQHWVQVTVLRGGTTYVDAYGTLSDAYGMRLKREDTTGAAATGTAIAAGEQLLSVVANEAGEETQSGGPILAGATLANRAYIFSTRSIRSILYVGVDAGTFTGTDEVTFEGLFGRYAFVKIGEDRIFLIGQREMYEYKGGRDLTPVARQHMRTFYEEVDRARADEILMWHNEGRNEIVVVYPLTTGGQRVLLYNFLEGSATFDVYPTAFGEVTAGASLRWRQDVPWEAMTEDWNSTTYAGTTWEYWSRFGVTEQFPVMAFEGRSPSILTDVSDSPVKYPLVARGERPGGLHAGVVIHSEGDTPDFDFNAPANWKYGFGVSLVLQVTEHLDPRPFFINVQLGGRATADADVVWSKPIRVEISGNGSVFVNKGVRAAGRYLRLRVWSEQANARWRISEYTIKARLGGSH